MTSLYLSDILDHWVVGRTRALIEPKRRTLREMARLPAHLIDDVNARGLPADSEFPPSRTAASINESYRSYKIYSFD